MATTTFLSVTDLETKLVSSINLSTQSFREKLNSTTFASTLSSINSIVSPQLDVNSETLKDYMASRIITPAQLLTKLNTNLTDVVTDLTAFVSGSATGSGIDFLCGSAESPFDGISDTVEDFFESLGESANSLIDSISNFDLSDAIETALSDMISTMDSSIRAIASGVVSAIDLLFSSISEQVSALSDAVETALSVLVNVPGNIVDGIRRGFVATLDFIKSLFSEESKFDLKKKIIAALKSFFDGFGSISETLSKLIQFKLCEELDEVEKDIQSDVDKINSQIADIEKTKNKLDAASKNNQIVPAREGRKIVDEESKTEIIQTQKNKLALTEPVPGRQGTTTLKVSDVTRIPVVAQAGLSKQEILKNSFSVLENIVDPIYKVYGKDMIITSGLRHVKINRKSQHHAGEAVDLQFRNIDKYQYLQRAKDIQKLLVNGWDQFILEYFGSNRNPVIHISFVRIGSQRNQTLTGFGSSPSKATYISGLSDRAVAIYGAKPTVNIG